MQYSGSIHLKSEIHVDGAMYKFFLSKFQISMRMHSPHNSDFVLLANQIVANFTRLN